MVLPSCQDTGTAIVKGKKGQYVLTGGGDEAALARGVFETYQSANLRYSQMAPLDMYREVNTGTNLPAEIKISAVDGDAYKFLFMAKGGGSANKSYLFQETKALLNPETLLNFVAEKMDLLGTSACPPYHLALVIGGTSAELSLETAKLASARYLDSLPLEGNELGRGFRDVELENRVLEVAQRLRHRRPVRRQVLLPRRAGHPPPPPRRVLPGGHRRLLLRRPPGARQDHRRGRVPRAARARPGPLPARAHRRPLRRRRRADRPQPAHGRDPGRALEAPGQDPGRAQRPDDRGPRHRPRQDQGAHRARRGAAPVPQGPLRLLRGPGQDPRGLPPPGASVPPPPAGWTPTSTCSSSTGAAT